MKLKREVGELLLTIMMVVGCHTAKSLSMALPAFDKEGHRGARGLMPENTIPAMQKALELGVTTLEMDVVITADSQVLVSHDPFFNHDISTLPDGSLIDQKDEKSYNIFKMSFAATQKIDVGMKPHPKFPRQQKMPVHKPLLSDLLKATEAYVKDHHLPLPFYNIETKSTRLTDNIFHPGPRQFVDLVLKEILKAGVEARVIIQSFDIRTLQEAHSRYPELKTALLIEDFDKRKLDLQLGELGFIPTIYSPAQNLVNDSLIADCHGRGMKIIPWTVNDPARIKALRSMGVDGLISDYPDLF